MEQAQNPTVALPTLRLSHTRALQQTARHATAGSLVAVALNAQFLDLRCCEAYGDHSQAMEAKRLHAVKAVHMQCARPVVFAPKLIFS